MSEPLFDDNFVISLVFRAASRDLKGTSVGELGVRMRSTENAAVERDGIRLVATESPARLSVLVAVNPANPDLSPMVEVYRNGGDAKPGPWVRHIVAMIERLKAEVEQAEVDFERITNEMRTKEAEKLQAMHDAWQAKPLPAIKG